MKPITRKAPRPHIKPKVKRKSIKRPKLPTLKKALWAVTRLLVFKTYGRDCFTCPNKNLEGSNCQGGHVPFHHSELSMQCRYDIRFIRPQCFSCNLRKGGKGGAAFLRMRAEGIDVEALWAENLITKDTKIPTQWFVDKKTEYQSMLISTLAAIDTNDVLD